MKAGPVRRSLWQVFALPVAFGVLSAVGLVAALLGDGVWDAVSWLTLGAAVAACAHHGLPWRRRPAGARR